MRIFRVHENIESNHTGYVEASHQWSLPGISCPFCKQVWATTGISYPSINLSEIAENKLFKKAGVVEFVEFERLRKIIQVNFPQLDFLPPGTNFGSLIGITKEREFNGFVPSVPWNLLIEGKALKKLQNNYIKLPEMIEAKLKFKKTSYEIYEFELLPIAILKSEIEGKESCKICGRDQIKLDEKVTIYGKSIPQNTDIFRVKNFPTLILVTEKFKQTVTDFDIKGLRFQEVEII